MGSTWLVLHHWTVRNTVVTTTTSQACPELLPAFLSSVSWFIAEFVVLSQLPPFHLDSLVSNNVSPSIRPLVVVVDVITSSIPCSYNLISSLNYILQGLNPRQEIFCKGSVDTPLTGVDTMLQTQGKIMKNWSSSVDTSSSSVDTRDSFPKTFWPIWDSSVDTRSDSVDTRDLPRTPSGLFWDSVSTLAQVTADTTGKKNSLVWGSPTSPVAKNSSTRP
ncbi:hypothetical protein Taro_018412 [Colocasia esculenta]|uniref:Uncharacterized protein n=1 Tax=Colocasia esculenta TaxID=4460 RepID=A0A843UTR3_COLES|nr:hypothetical protein [Colocasia esculenta]